MGAETVKVVVRCRPLNQKEVENRRENIVDVEKGGKELNLKPSKEDPTTTLRSFAFDAVYGVDSKQVQIFDDIARPILDSVVEGFNGTIFCYGQTGSGKTHTMEGKDGEQAGIIPRTFQEVFQLIQQDPNREYLVRASFLEIYNEEVRDLLAKDSKAKLEVHENQDGVYVKGLSSFVVRSVDEMNKVLEVGKKNRSVGATLMNQDSSRSHSIFTVTVETSESDGQGGSRFRVGKLNLVDLAGSERQSKTGATGDRLKEATKINLSLSALGNVISALVDGNSAHIPYRDSKLTRLLQDSLGGNTKTVMVANINPADWNYDETLSTLRYASRAKLIKNQPKINEDPKDAMLRQFQEEIQRLRAELAAAEGDGSVGGEAVGGGGDELCEADMAALREQIERELVAEYSSQGRSMDATTLQEIRVEASQRVNEGRFSQDGSGGAGGKKSLEDQLQEKQRMAVEKAKRKQRNANLQQKLKAMESKLLHGDKKLQKSAQKQQEEIKRKQAALQQSQEAEEEAKGKVAELEEIVGVEKEKYNSLQEEADAKRKKMSKLDKRMKEIDTELEEIYKDWQQEKTGMLDTIRAMRQELELKELVIEAFIPASHVVKVRPVAVWNDESGGWEVPMKTKPAEREQSVPAVRKRPGSGVRRPGSAKGGGLSPGRGDKLQLQMDLHDRTTNDYVSPRRTAWMQAQAAEDEGAMFYAVDGGERVFLADADELSHQISEVPASYRPGTASRRAATAMRR